MGGKHTHKSEKEKNTITNPFVELDNLKIPNNPLVYLKFYEKFEEEFPILRHFLLADFMNFLNNFHPDGDYKERAPNAEEETLTKEDWIRFFDLKIITSPIIVRLNISQNEINQQKQLWDDIFDDIKEVYELVNKYDASDIPKSYFFSVGFVFCMNKKSQKIIILMNLFTGKDNKIIMTGNFYAFFFLIYYFVLITPNRFFEKEITPDMAKDNYMKKIERKDVEGINRNNIQLKGSITNLVNEILDIFFKNGDESYTRDEFKKKLLDEKNNFIFSNNCLKHKIEEKMKEKGIKI